MNIKPKRFVEYFFDHDGGSLAKEINDYAKGNDVNIIDISLVKQSSCNDSYYEAIVLFEYEDKG